MVTATILAIINSRLIQATGIDTKRSEEHTSELQSQAYPSRMPSSA